MSPLWSVAERVLGRRLNRDLAILLLPVGFVVGTLAVGLVIILLMVFFIAGQSGGGCGTSVPVGAPASQLQGAADDVRYFESQGMTAIASAGIVGNLEQESSLNPYEPGGRLAQWIGSRYQPMVTWTIRAGYPADSRNPATSTAGQLMYLVYDLRTTYATLLAQMNAATDVAAATDLFQNVYEGCSDCRQSRREGFAAAALAPAGRGGVVQASLASGACVAVGGGGGDPIPGFSPGRDDMGVDACARPGMPIVAPSTSQLVEILPGWYSGQPLMLLRFVPPIAGTYRGDQYWYVAEQISPASLAVGTVFQAGQPVATFAPSGTCVEVGWGSPTTGSRTLVSTDASPPAGALTPEAEAFKTYFHIPWVGRSP